MRSPCHFHGIGLAHATAADGAQRHDATLLVRNPLRERASLRRIGARELLKGPTSRFNEAIKRNLARFPADFFFQLTKEEAASLTSQIAISKAGEAAASLTSQIAILKAGRGRHRKYLPYAFTEHGALQAANVVKSERAVAMSVFVIRAFVRLRAELSRSAALAAKLAELDRRLTGRLDTHERAIVHFMQKLVEALTPKPPPPDPPRPRIGFQP